MPTSRSLFRPSARLAPLALAALCLAGTARAQSLQELYEAARSYDATYLAARAQSEAAEYQAAQTYALQRPSVALTASANRDINETPYSNVTRTASTTTPVTVSAQQSLFNRPNSLTIDQADKTVEVAKTQLQAAEQDLIVRLSQAYFDVLGAADTLATVQANKKAISEQLASAKRNFEVGTATITDTREAQASYDLVVAQELAADNDLRVKQLALEQLVGRTGIKPWPLAKPVALPPLMPADLNTWLSTAEDRSPSIAQARLALDIAKLETEKARAGHLPTLALTGSYTKGRVDIDTDPTAHLSGTNTNKSIGVTLSVPLFSGFATQNRIQETLKLEDKAVNDLEGTRRSIAQGTRSAFLGVQSGLAQVKAYEAAEASNKLSLEATQLGYKVGVRVNLDVLTAQTQLFNTEQQLSKARYDVIMGDLKLRQVTGQLNESDIQRVNGLLAR
ncbi:TolC family outer membrane protein [Ideonella dechloratans]|uniref:TolC family outer membrane protein n=1 Tax=Ideonella dechloratans TaxID=36863 RepID=A0A643F9T0_IDEDE|nr:TolC family outer membrane protein [Ideonella dechloratans]KAB0579510.1 TolC family outer membrane protein [Ideonella dechloratans]UFU11620.1 TolC family outer membrane protein [Ideonella dechloratans]